MVLKILENCGPLVDLNIDVSDLLRIEFNKRNKQKTNKDG